MKKLILSIILGVLLSLSPTVNSLAGEKLVGTFLIGDWKEESVGSLAIAKMVGDGWLTYSIQEPTSFIYLKKSDWGKIFETNEAIDFCHSVGSFIRLIFYSCKKIIQQYQQNRTRKNSVGTTEHD